MMQSLRAGSLSSERRRADAVPPAAASVTGLPSGAAALIVRAAGWRAGSWRAVPSGGGALEALPRPCPALEWAARALERTRPPPLPAVLCHGDFRTGNYLVAAGRLSGLLDWEFAGWGDRHADLGWFCQRYWRRHRPER